MAQTIAAQRGVTTVNGNGTTATTLFTQSTGISTRVILNSVAIKHDNGAMTRAALCINLNGTGNYACVALKSVSASGNDTYGLNMMPGSNVYPVQTSGNTGSPYPDRWTLFASNFNAYLGSTLVNNRMAMNGPNGAFLGGNSICVDFVPSQFWMNNGDSLVLLHFNTNGYTADALYSFTTITES